MPNELKKVLTEDEVVAQDTEDYLRARSIVDAINAALPEGAKALKHIPPDFVIKRPSAEVAQIGYHIAFVLCGGAPRLAQWADQNYEKFLGQYLQIATKATEQTAAGGVSINFNSQIPTNPLDRVTLSDDGMVIDTGDVPE